MQRLFLFLFAGLVAGAMAWVPPRAVAGGGPGPLSIVHDNDTPDNRVFGFRLESNGALTADPRLALLHRRRLERLRRPLPDGGLLGPERPAVRERRERGHRLPRGRGRRLPLGGDRLTLRRRARPWGLPSWRRLADLRLRLRGSTTTASWASRSRRDDTLAPVPGSPFPSGPDPVGLSTARGFLFAALEEDGQIAAFKVRGDGALVAVPGSPFDTPAEFIYNVHAVAGREVRLRQRREACRHLRLQGEEQRRAGPRDRLTLHRRPG